VQNLLLSAHKPFSFLPWLSFHTIYLWSYYELQVTVPFFTQATAPGSHVQWKSSIRKSSVETRVDRPSTK